MTSPTILVMSRAPVPGKAKTRLAATVGDDAAAELAGHALLDTVVAATATGLPVTVAMSGDQTASPMRREIDAALADHNVIEQRGDDFAERLVAAHAAADDGRGVVQVGMDTPQLSSRTLNDAATALDSEDAVLGMANDGGWWLLALRDAQHAQCLLDVPMSTSRTGQKTHAALRDRGVSVGQVAALTDVDTWPDALEVAVRAPGTRFAAAVTRIRQDRSERR